MAGIFERALTTKRWTAVSGTIDEHFGLVRQLFQKLFDGKPFNSFMQETIKGADKLLKDEHISDAQQQQVWSALPGGKGSKVRTAFINLVESKLQEAMNALEPVERRPSISKYSDLLAAGRVVFPSASLQRRLDAGTQKKIASVFDYGSSYKGHGPTRSLGAGVLHAHVGNGDGIAFSWNNNTLTIHGYGVKSDSAAPGNSGYSWTTS